MQTVDPYKEGMFKGFTNSPFAAKTDVVGRIKVVLDGRLEGRNLQLISPVSRALCQNEIHELILTDEEAGPGSRVNRIAYLGFMEISEGGVMVAGDELQVRGKKIGEIAGFDETHMPNHWNIVVRTSERISGLERGVELGDEVRSVHRKGNNPAG